VSASHDAHAYERPTHPYRCGRRALWRGSCWQGPSVDGGCGGAFECIPVRSGDRWECRRPKQAGGRCAEGPLPDGRCQHQHAACVPQANLRRIRARVSLLAAAALLVLLVVGPDPTVRSVVNPGAIDAGGLSRVHAGFTSEQGCGACHASHAKDGAGWLAAAFRDNDTSARCLECHSFAEPAMGAHNSAHPKRSDLREVPCARCHQEHRGGEVALRQAPDYVCANCHRSAFDNFARSHPPFAERFPYTHPGAINFNHAKHIREYFTDAKHAKRSPKFAAIARTQCTVCHEVESATREVRPKPYAEICAGCHEAQVQKAELVLLEPERLTAAGALLLGLPKDGDEAEATARLGKLWQEMARSGPEALSARVAARDPAGRKRTAALFDGLDAGAVRAAGSAWSAKRPLPQQDAPERPGWFAGDNAEGNPALFYRPRGHADALVRAWIEHARAGTEDKDRGEIAADAFDQFLDAETGPGVCGKCHAAALRAAPVKESAAAWKHAGAPPRPFVRYSHAPHLELLDPEAGCRNCHELGSATRYVKYHAAKQPKASDYASAFAGIKKETCVGCHREGHVDASCQVCHEYHKDHRLNLSFRQKSTREVTPK
jgi:predicted CXXCH cytochrome family protein